MSLKNKSQVKASLSRFSRASFRKSHHLFDRRKLKVVFFYVASYPQLLHIPAKSFLIFHLWLFFSLSSFLLLSEEWNFVWVFFSCRRKRRRTTRKVLKNTKKKKFFEHKAENDEDCETYKNVIKSKVFFSIQLIARIKWGHFNENPLESKLISGVVLIVQYTLCRAIFCLQYNDTIVSYKNRKMTRSSLVSHYCCWFFNVLSIQLAVNNSSVRRKLLSRVF